MAISPNALIALGALASLVSFLGLFKEFRGDDWTRVLVTFTGAILWAAFGVSAFSVETVTSCCVVEQEYTGLAYLGIGGALIVALFGLNQLFNAFSSTADNTGLLS